MKKWMIAVILLLVVCLLVLGVFLCVRFVGLYQSAKQPEAESGKLSVEQYAAERLAEFDVSYDAAARLLTLSRTAGMNYDDARSYGGRVYVDELAPETYLDQARSIALDAIASTGCAGLCVKLSYLSTDGQEIFSAASDGTVWKCWESVSP